MTLVIPKRLAKRCGHTREESNWLDRLPAVVGELRERWNLTIDAPFDNDEVSCAWVAPVLRSDRSPAVLKVSMPHFEADDETAGLRFWDGDPTVRLIDAAEDLGAMLLERCEPGSHLRVLRSEHEQTVVIARLLRRLWRPADGAHPFRHLSVLTARWVEETRAQSAHWPDADLIRHGLSVLQELSRPASDDVLLATDLHAGNVLSARREEWLVIDPKPFVGDRAYDATQHLLNCPDTLCSNALEAIERFADLLAVSAHRVRLWMFARTAAEPKDNWLDDRLMSVARALAP